MAEETLIAPENLGAVYTPAFLAEWVARELLSCLPAGEIRVLDPACGDGALLSAVRATSGRRVSVVGMDVDSSAIDEARNQLGGWAEFIVQDTLLSPIGPLAERRVDAVIANPPWGGDLSVSKKVLRDNGYELARGQCDSFELFIEKCVRDAPTGTPMAFIIPDSIFLPEHESLRRLLVTRCSLRLIARLGEGFFPGVFRGTVVLVFVTGPPTVDHEVECMRLPADMRRRVLREALRFDVVKRVLLHRVPQRRFQSNPRCELDIDVPVKEGCTLERFEVRPMDWSRWFHIGRGVELGKSGAVIPCPKCAHHRPVPRSSSDVACKGCGSLLDVKDRTSIMQPLSEVDDDGWWPLIVGEDVKRYICAPSRAIKLQVDGIQYKPHSEFAARKLLVRKTGIGLKAAIDESGSYTTQVVFHFIPREGAPPFVLDYLLGVLCSRVMLAFHLRTSGESEWRSHPYVTPKVLTQLPIPDFSDDAMMAKAREIAVAVRTCSENPSKELDLHVDRLVVDLFQLRLGDCEWIARTLDSAQSLEAIAPLRVDAAELLPVRESRNGISVHRQ